jgi:hypothetical protein
MDHGTQYLSDHFQNQIKFWGITPSFAFVAEPSMAEFSAPSTMFAKL